MSHIQGELDVLAALADSPEKFELIYKAEELRLQLGSYELESLYWEQYEKERQLEKLKKKQLRQQRMQQRRERVRSAWRNFLIALREAVIAGASSMATLSYPIDTDLQSDKMTGSNPAQETRPSTKVLYKESKKVRFYIKSIESSSTIAVHEDKWSRQSSATESTS